jgi:tripartite-type tricarboxylate transporter receptor subunit TctC
VDGPDKPSPTHGPTPRVPGGFHGNAMMPQASGLACRALARWPILFSIKQASGRNAVLRKLWTLTLLMLLVGALPAAADDYPDRTIHAIAVQGPGGLSDIFMRALADGMTKELGQSVVVENRPGASGTRGARACAESPPDGYTICIVNAEPITINPVIFPNPNFDPKKDLVPITRVFYLTTVFAVNASLGVKSFAELAKLVRSKPKTFNYLSPTLAKVAFMVEFNKTNSTDFVRVPFKGGGDAVNSMLAGTTPVAMFGIGNLIQLIRAGKILGFAVDGDKRSPLAPEIPTFRETGYTKFLGASFFGIYTPAGTPKPMIDKLNQVIAKVAGDPEFQKHHMTPRGLTPVLDSPEHFAKALEQDRADGLEVIKASGLYPNVK